MKTSGGPNRSVVGAWAGAAVRAARLVSRLFVLSLAAHAASYGQSGKAPAVRVGEREVGRLSRLIEANIIATHAYQVLLARKSGKGDAGCYDAGGLSEAELEALVAHQAGLLKSPRAAVRAWARGQRSGFAPAKDLEPLLGSGLRVPARAPVNVFTDYLRRNTENDARLNRAVANLYQTVLEIDRDGDRLQEAFAFYAGLSLPVYVGQLRLPGGDEALLAAGRELAARTCASPFATDAAAWQIAGRKVWNWGEKHLHVRDERVLAADLLRGPDVRALLPRIRALPAQKIAVVGHSFTMGQHWSSPSSFVPVVIDIFRRENPRVEFRQFAAGGLTAARAEQRFYRDVLAWKPDQVLLVVMARREEDYEALGRLGAGFAAAGIRAYAFDKINDPAAINPATAERMSEAARAAGITVIEVGRVLDSAPDRDRFLSLDRIHMTEPYHRLMAKEWLGFLAGARRAELGVTTKTPGR